MSNQTATLKDQFAMAALTGFLASEDREFEMSRMYSPKEAADRAYKIAEAMMERKRQNEAVVARVGH